jgi:protein disulfide-isomerase A1
VTRQSLPTISTVTADSLQGLKSTSNVVVVGYFAPDDNISHEAFTSVAEAMHEDYVFGITHDGALAKKEQINAPGIVLYKNFDEGKNAFELTHDSQAISTFIKAAGTPLVAEFHPELHFGYIDVGLESYDQPIPSTKYAL